MALRSSYPSFRLRTVVDLLIFKYRLGDISSDGEGDFMEFIDTSLTLSSFFSTRRALPPIVDFTAERPGMPAQPQPLALAGSTATSASASSWGSWIWGPQSMTGAELDNIRTSFRKRGPWQYCHTDDHDSGRAKPTSSKARSGTRIGLCGARSK
jgi:hypothetical protein